MLRIYIYIYKFNPKNTVSNFFKDLLNDPRSNARINRT